jgi:histidinol-phosphate aminotransferase
MDLDAALSRINPKVRALKPYHLTIDTVDVKLNQNENPFDWPAEIKEEVAAFVRTRHWNRYPDFIPETLKQALASYTGVDSDSIIVGNGSNEMLLVLLLSLTGPSRPLITCQPTFTVYRLLASGMGHDSDPVFLSDDLRFDTTAILEACAKNPDAVLLLCSPNNPTGSALSEPELRSILDTHTGFVIVDQAYVEFGAFNAIPLIADYPNLIVTRTFSKAFSAAGLRLGYMLGQEKIIAEINKIKLPYNINFFSDYTATVLLSHTDILQDRIEYLVKERNRMRQFFMSVPSVKTWDSAANFILIRTAEKDALMQAFRRDSILVRDVSSYPMLKDCMRISTGSADENDRLMQSMAKFYKGNS